MNSLCGTLFVYNGNKYDYCYKEAIISLICFCDYVVIVAGGTDGTVDDVLRMPELNINEFWISTPNTEKWKGGKSTVIKISESEWEAQTGKEKLNYFTNIAIQEADRMGFTYQFNLQSDEIVHEKSYDAIRTAIQDNCDGYLCSRINLWESPYKKLIAPQNRQPCSTQVIRLAKVNRRSVGDAESLAVNELETKYTDAIRIYHMGFVRDRKIMKDKVIHMQENVFGVNHDPKLDGSDVFIPQRWFGDEDLELIDEPLPEIIQGWAEKRVY